MRERSRKKKNESLGNHSKLYNINWSISQINSLYLFHHSSRKVSVFRIWKCLLFGGFSATNNCSSSRLHIVAQFTQIYTNCVCYSLLLWLLLLFLERDKMKTTFAASFLYLFTKKEKRMDHVIGNRSRELTSR